MNSVMFYRLLSAVELIAAEGLFVSKLVKRRHFIWRVIISVLAIALISLFFPEPYNNAWYVSFVYLTIFFISILAMAFCFDENWWNILFCAFAAYTIKQIAYVLSYLIVDTFDIWSLFGGSIVNPYTTSDGILAGQTPLTIVVFLDVFFGVYWASYFLLVDRMEKGEDMRFGGYQYLWLTIVIVLIDFVFNMIAIYYLNESLALLVERLYNIVTCLLALSLQFGMLHERKSDMEVSFLQELLHKGEKQYRLSKSTVDSINIKAHDLKQQIRQIGSQQAIGTVALSEIEEAVSTYDSVIKTGNEALDTILTEKSFYCDKNHIKLTCMVDGKTLSFMTPEDIYSLFGNAVDNAIEATESLPPEKRIITLVVKKEKGVISIHIENYFEGNISFDGAFPKTRKTDKMNHGFGFKSMALIVNKYGGSLSAKALNGIFNLNMAFLGK